MGTPSARLPGCFASIIIRAPNVSFRRFAGWYVARGESLIRQWKLLSALQSNRVGVCLDDLADIVGYNRRTVQRDLRMLKEAVIPHITL